MRRSFIAVLAVLLIPAALDAAGIRQKKIKSQPFCNFYDLMTGNKFRTVLQDKQSSAYGRGFSSVFTRSQRRMLCNNIKIELLVPPVYEGRQMWLGTVDWYKTLRPVFYPATVSRRKISSVMIDMGHGGNDPGALGAFSKEKNITLRVGKRVGQLLEACGYKVKYTRTTDVQVNLNRIGTLQRQSGSDLFVSIHVNSAADKSISGIETYCLTPSGCASSNGGKASSTVYRGNQQDAANMLLAWNIQKSLLARTRAVDRGIKRARFAVLRDIDAPGVLVEIGFISNRKEERLLNDPEYIDRIAYGIVDGIIGFGRSAKPR
ncbi:MAG: N-acetylmuramoyl-L-alanine amidase [Lentisphaerae bacterium]|nr:N-acetylmuramoyl-L-alanine amidase [Lentisphaerota bacterium]